MNSFKYQISTKEIWNILKEIYIRIEEFKRSKLNTLSQEYELFRRLHHEIILDMKKKGLPP